MSMVGCLNRKRKSLTLFKSLEFIFFVMDICRKKYLKIFSAGYQLSTFWKYILNKNFVLVLFNYWKFCFSEFFKSWGQFWPINLSENRWVDNPEMLCAPTVFFINLTMTMWLLSYRRKKEEIFLFGMTFKNWPVVCDPKLKSYFFC